MISADFDFLVFIGRFQPFHRGHLQLLHQALERSRHVVVVCGSARQPRSLRNPFTDGEREQMIRACLNREQNQRVSVMPVMDQPYNQTAWVSRVQAAVNEALTAPGAPLAPSARIGLVGRRGEHRSFPVRCFPQWGELELDDSDGLSSSAIRSLLFARGSTGLPASLARIEEELKHPMPPAVERLVRAFTDSAPFRRLLAEQEFVDRYRSGWDAAPFPPTFVTVDAVVLQCAHVLLVERGNRPGQGLWALPGGFVDQRERIEDACLRELREETCLELPESVLRGALRCGRVFDDPYRSVRGRIITHAFLMELPPAPRLPGVAGADDARRAFWLPLAALDPCKMFEDHYFIIQHLVGA